MKSVPVVNLKIKILHIILYIKYQSVASFTKVVIFNIEILFMNILISLLIGNLSVLCISLEAFNRVVSENSNNISIRVAG